MLQHEPVVGCQVGFTLHRIDYHALSLAAWRRRKLHMAGEGGTSQTYDTCVLDLLDDGFAVQLCMVGQLHQCVAAVDALFPLVTFYIHVDGSTACSAGIQNGVYLGHLAADTAVDGCTHKTSSLCQKRTHLHLIALLDNWLGRSTYMLEHAEDSLLGQ